MTKEERLWRVKKIKKSIEDDCLLYSELMIQNLKMIVKNENLNDRNTLEQILALLYKLNAVDFLERDSQRPDFLMEKTHDDQWVISDDELKETDSEKLVGEYVYLSMCKASNIQYLDINQLIHAIQDPLSPKNVLKRRDEHG